MFIKMSLLTVHSEWEVFKVNPKDCNEGPLFTGFLNLLVYRPLAIRLRD